MCFKVLTENSEFGSATITAFLCVCSFAMFLSVCACSSKSSNTLSWLPTPDLHTHLDATSQLCHLDNSHKSLIKAQQRDALLSCLIHFHDHIVWQQAGGH